MPLLKLWEMIAPAVLLTLGACSSTPQIPVQPPPAEKHLDLPDTRLPGNTQSWTSWTCDNAMRIETRYATQNGQQIRLKYQGSEVTLERQPGHNPIIYENALLSFFSDGEYAVIGSPASDRVMLGGCKVMP